MTPQVDWLIDCAPRPVQIEALLRSYRGFRTRDGRDQEPVPVQFRKGPARGWGHYLEMRLGKTPTLLNEYALFARDYSFNKLVVISPSSYKEDWCREVPKFGLIDEVVGLESSKKSVAAALKSGVMVVNYEALKSEETAAILSDFIDKKTLFAVDESIKIKNPTSLQTKAVLELAKKAGAKRALSGLPFTQSPADLYPQFRMMGELDGTNYYAFRNRFCKMGGFKKKKVVGIRNEEALQELKDQFCFVAKRRDWADWREPSYFSTSVKFEPAQAKAYKEMNDELYLLLESGDEVSASQVISKMLKLQQISSGFVHDNEGRVHWLVPPHKNPKLIRLIELLEETEQKAVVVFHYKAAGDLLLEALAQYEPATIRSSEWMKRAGRDAIEEKKRFNNDPKSRVILVNEGAKYGHDLSGNPKDRCGLTVFFENTYNLDDRTQLEMRNTVGEGQDWDNMYIDLVTSPVEQKAVDALVKKMSVVEAIMGSYGGSRERTAV